MKFQLHSNLSDRKGYSRILFLEHGSTDEIRSVHDGKNEPVLKIWDRFGVRISNRSVPRESLLDTLAERNRQWARQNTSNFFWSTYVWKFDPLLTPRVPFLFPFILNHHNKTLQNSSLIFLFLDFFKVFSKFFDGFFFDFCHFFVSIFGLKLSRFGSIYA